MKFLNGFWPLGRPTPLGARLADELESMSSQAPRRDVESAPAAEEYDEETFRYFLDVERARAGRSNDSLRLLFASFEQAPGKPAPMPPGSAERLFKGLKVALRETDVMGWYRQGRVAGAVLIDRPGSPANGFGSLIEQRVGDELRHRLPAKVANSLRVRVMHLTPRRTERVAEA